MLTMGEFTSPALPPFTRTPGYPHNSPPQPRRPRHRSSRPTAPHRPVSARHASSAWNRPSKSSSCTSIRCRASQIHFTSRFVSYMSSWAVSLQSPTIAALEANATEALANTTLKAAMSGEAFRDPAKETYYCQLPQPLHWCGHAPPPNPPDRTGDIHAPHPPAVTPILFHTSNVYDPAGR